MDTPESNHEDFKVTCPVDCGNAPKKRFLRDLNIAMIRKDEGLIAESMADDVQWNIIGGPTIQGKDHIFDTLNQRITGEITELQIQNIITHGKEGSVNGLLTFNDQKRIAFCHVCQFTSAGKKAKIREITSYVIKTP